MKLLLIGQAPSARSADVTKALEGSLNVVKLCRLFGCSWREYIQETERINVLGYWPGKAGKGDVFPIAEARALAVGLLPKLRRRKVLFVGKATARVFGCEAPPCQWDDHYNQHGWAFAFAIIPHLSGVNRWWNDPNHHAQAEAFMREAWANRKAPP